MESHKVHGTLSRVDGGVDVLENRSPATEIVELSDVNLDLLMEDMDTICSPSDALLNGITNGCTESSSSYPNYLWHVKKHAQSLRPSDFNSINSLKNAKLSYQCGSNSDADSTCGMVNIHHNSSVNLCENPSDMWFGLKMSDGTPVVISSRNKNFKHSTKYRRHSVNVPRFFGSPTQGPIDYSSGFLSISKYVARGSGATEIYTSKRTAVRKREYFKKFSARKTHRERVQQHLAKTRGIY